MTKALLTAGLIAVPLLVVLYAINAAAHMFADAIAVLP